MIHGILTGSTLNFSSTTHKPCLYHESINNTPIFLLHQLDNFAVAAPDQDTSKILFNKIQAELKQPLKILGLLTVFNGINVKQSKRFVRLLRSTYITKILEDHDWLRPTQKSPLCSPMNHEKSILKELETS